jgi:hypothetical protein
MEAEKAKSNTGPGWISFAGRISGSGSLKSKKSNMAPEKKANPANSYY